MAAVDSVNQSLRAGMGVETEGRSHTGMAKHRCHHVRRLAVVEREGSRGMPQGRGTRLLVRVLSSASAPSAARTRSAPASAARRDHATPDHRHGGCGRVYRRRCLANTVSAQIVEHTSGSVVLENRPAACGRGRRHKPPRLRHDEGASGRESVSVRGRTYRCAAQPDGVSRPSSALTETV